MNYYEKQLFIDQQIRLEALRELEEDIPMTLPERDKVRRWVRSGHDVETNPWGYTDGEGYPLNYLEALRMDQDVYELMKLINEEK